MKLPSHEKVDFAAGAKTEALALGFSKKHSRRSFLKYGAAAAAGIGALKGKSAYAANEVTVLAWTVYVTPEISAIMKKHGVNMRGVPAATDQDMFTKIKAGGAGSYDIVFANCGWSPTYYKAGLVEAFDIKEVPGWDEIWPVFREDTSFPYVLEPNKVILFPYSWDTMGLIWNVDLAKLEDPQSWSNLWDPRFAGKVIFRDGPEEYLAISALSLGMPRDEIYSMTGETLLKAARHLAELKPFQIAPSDALLMNALRSGKAWIGEASNLALSGQLNRESGKQVAKSVIPSEGSIGWIDGPMIVKGTQNREAALKFIEIWNGPEMQEHLFEKQGYPLCNRVANEKVLAKGGDAAQQILDRKADTPDVVKQIAFMRPPENPAEWAQAYAEVVGG